jgi:Holliday junction resolvase YEN1
MNSSGKDDGNHVVIYKSEDFQRPDITLTQGGLILIAILSGGDYHQAGLPGCGPNIAHGLAKCGFGDSLLHAAQTMSRDDLSIFLSTWRQDLCNELRTNSRGIIGRKNPSLAKSVPDDFPKIDILFSYTSPITSESEGKAHKINFIWDRKLDLGRIANMCELYFEWGVRRVIIKRFRTVIWPGAVLRLLREEALRLDGKSSHPTGTSTPPRKRRGQNTPVPSPSSSISKGLSALQLSDGSDDKVIVKIHSARNHASTDGLLEYRLEIAPRLIVLSAEAGIKDIRPPLVDDLEEDDDDDEEEDVAHNMDIKRSGKRLLDPHSHFRVWMPASMVQLAEPSMVNDYEDNQKRKREKKAKLTLTNRPSKNISGEVSRSPQRAPLVALPFPVAFDPDSDDLFADNQGQSSRRRERSPPSHSETDSLEKSPRKCVKHTSPRSKPTQHKAFSDTSSSRAPSPSPVQSRPLPSKMLRDAIIEISSDSDEEKRPTTDLKPSAAPLLLAKARTKPGVTKRTIRKSQDIIDLT